MFGFEAEGLKTMAIYLGMVLGSGLLVWLIGYFSKFFDVGFKVVKPMFTIAKELTTALIKDKTKRKEVERWTNFIEQGVLVVENRKNEIDSEYPDKTPTEMKNIYRETALEIAEELAASQGIMKPDVLTTSIANALLEAIINFLPTIKQKETVTVVSLGKLKSDK